MNTDYNGLSLKIILAQVASLPAQDGRPPCWCRGRIALSQNEAIREHDSECQDARGFWQYLTSQDLEQEHEDSYWDDPLRTTNKC